jgi:hypothetical protein
MTPFEAGPGLPLNAHDGLGKWSRLHHRTRARQLERGGASRGSRRHRQRPRLGDTKRRQYSAEKAAAITTNVVRQLSCPHHRHDSNTPPAVNLLDDGVGRHLLGSDTIVQ